METLSQAMNRLERLGYTDSVSAQENGKLLCSACDNVCDPADLTIDEMVRFEGDSDPDDQAVLFALNCGAHKSLYTSVFGPETPPNDVKAVRALSQRHRS